jgi:hypothetical protein
LDQEVAQAKTTTFRMANERVLLQRHLVERDESPHEYKMLHG